MIKNMQIKSLVMVLLFSNLMGAENHPKAPSFFGTIRNYTAGYFAQSCSAANKVGSTLFGVDASRPVSGAEAAEFAVGYGIGACGFWTLNWHLMKVGGCCIIISTLPMFVCGRPIPQAPHIKREDTLLSKSAAALSLAATLYYLKRNL